MVTSSARKRFVVFACVSATSVLAAWHRSAPAQVGDQPAAAPAPPPAQPPRPRRGGKPRVPPAATSPAPPRIRPQVNLAGSIREYRPVYPDDSQVARSIRAALDGPAGAAEFVETPLRDVISAFEKWLGTPVRIDIAALTDCGIDVDATTVTAKVTKGSTVRAAWRPILREVGLTWIVSDDALVVTTLERAQERLAVRAYPLPRGMRCVDKPAVLREVTDLIQSTVGPPTWDTVGGPGSIKPLEQSDEPLLVVSQTEEVHDEIESMLRAIHDRSFAEFAAGQPVLRVHHVADERARRELAGTLKDVCNGALGKAGDAEATVTAVDGTLAVKSTSPEFHDLAAQVIAAVADGQSPGPPPAAP